MPSVVTGRGKPRARAVALLAASALALTGCSMFSKSPDDPRADAAKVAKAFLASWSAGRIDEAAADTDNAAAAKAVLTDTNDKLQVTATKLQPGGLTGCTAGQDCKAPYTVTLSLKALGDWTYDSALTLVKPSSASSPGGNNSASSKAWQVHWASSVVHPQLTDTTRLGRVRALPERASILDHSGQPIVQDRPVVSVGVVPERIQDPAAVYAAVAAATGVDQAAFTARASAAKKNQFVEAITLRPDAYAAVQAKLALPGITTSQETRPLAPTSAFARAVLGTVAAPTEESLKNAGPTASAADLVGASGLQRTFQQQLAGTPGFQITLVDKKTEQSTGDPVYAVPGTPGAPVTTSLDTAVQEAADNALAGVTKTTALVAMDATTGGVLAVSNGPNASDNRAFTGHYPPGSTFKIVTSGALLAAGVTSATPVQCPQTSNIGGKNFKNYEYEAFSNGTLLDAFTKSCNTAFLSLADKLQPASLPTEAGLFGLGGSWDLGVSAYSGSVPAPGDAVEEAASMIGQSKVLASPLAMAAVAAAVDSGQPRVPVLLPGRQPAPAALAALPQNQVDELRTMMRATVQSGTAAGLAKYGEVYAKTGTAEYGTDVPPRTHAWMVGYRGNVAFAVIVEDGVSGASSAAPIVGKFLAALPR